ncbi:MAG: putative signal transduction histidine kinase [Acidimicrobiaceae bacterium]|nr:putative signal transduction histidine kinase [Acidimicrobiaceae bacterium]
MPYHGIRDPDQLQALLGAVLAIESDLELPGVLHRIAKAACSLTGARYGALGILDPSGKGLAQFVHVGMDDATAAAIGHLPEGAGILGLLIVEPTPLRLADLSAHPDSIGFPPSHPPMRSFIGAPLRIRGEVYGNLYVTEKRGESEFSESDEDIVVALAGVVGIAVDNARLHARLGELSLAADRERIARDLHDTVIQRLFATGLALQSALPLVQDPELRSRVEDAVRELDDTIRQVRTTIFALDPPPTAERGVRALVLETCAEAARTLGFEPEVRFVGAIDRRVGTSVATELLATLREALSNVARHARAHTVQVELSVDDAVHLRVTDDGVGTDVGTHSPGRGLPNIAERAELLGGTFTLSGRTAGGTEMAWHVPLG